MTLEIANRLQKLRKEKGYSQEQLAEELGISRQAVSKWERAEASPDTDNLICLAKLYGVSLDYLLSTEDSLEEIKEQTKSEPEVITEPIDDEEDEDKDEKQSKLSEAMNVVITMLIPMIYFVMGFLWGLWHPGWIIFMMIPVLTTLVSAIEEKDPSEFAFPVLAAAIYLFIGCVWHLWHPGWIIFLLIPVYYAITDSWSKDED